MLSQKLTLAAAGNAADPVYVDDVFSTFVYDGNGATQSINNGIDLSGEGGMVWLKRRNTANDHYIGDTARGVGKVLLPNENIAQLNVTASSTFASFNSNGFTVGGNAGYNGSSDEMCSWTFRKCPKFFDIVTYTGNNTMGHTINHNLGSVPGCIIVKNLDSATDWGVYHRGVPSAKDKKLYLNTNRDAGTDNWWNNTAPTATSFQLSTDPSVNQNGHNYVAYLFAHDEAAFGENEDESIIKCANYTGTGSLQYINVGFEPQWLLIKNTSTTGYNWILLDTMRGWNRNNGLALVPNNNDADSDIGLYSGLGIDLGPTATGFTMSQTYTFLNQSGENYIYIAIRRPHKPPTAGTDVFAMDQRTGSNPSYVSNFPVDMAFKRTINSGYSMQLASRMTGEGHLLTSSANQESTDPGFVWDYQDGWAEDGSADANVYSWMFKRAKGFFDVAAYTGNGANPGSFNHNLGVVPEMIWVKRRSAQDWWTVYHSSQGAGKEASINLDSAFTSNGRWSGNTPTATEVFVQNDGQVNQSGQKYVAYLFATVAGVSKVGSYSGSGTTHNIDCGFTNGARFVLIKRTDSAADWYLFDTTQGINSGSEPFLRLNLTTAQTTGDNFIGPLSSGFQLVTGDHVVNGVGADYIFLAIA